MICRPLQVFWKPFKLLADKVKSVENNLLFKFAFGKSCKKIECYQVHCKIYPFTAITVYSNAQVTH